MSQVQLFQSFPKRINAIQWICTQQNENDIKNFVGNHFEECYRNKDKALVIRLRDEGNLVHPSDWIVRDITGHFYPVPNVVFLKTYFRVTESPDLDFQAPNNQQSKTL